MPRKYFNFTYLQNKLFVLLIPVLFILVGGCSPEDKGKAPAVVRTGVLPDQSEAKLRDRYGVFLEYLSERLGIPFELVVPRDYNHLLTLFENGEIDFGYFGGATFLQAHKSVGAVPIAMRRLDLNFTTYFLAHRLQGQRSLQDFAGMSFTFGSELSTSGHIMPRYFLENAGIDPDAFFSEVGYSGAHDRSALLVQEQQVDLAAVNAVIADKMFADNTLRRDQVQIIWETPPYPDYTWAARQGLSEAFYVELLDAFLSLSPHDPAHGPILQNLDAKGFLPSDVNDFKELSDAMAARR